MSYTQNTLIPGRVAFGIALNNERNAANIWTTATLPVSVPLRGGFLGAPSTQPVVAWRIYDIGAGNGALAAEDLAANIPAGGSFPFAALRDGVTVGGFRSMYYSNADCAPEHFIGGDLFCIVPADARMPPLPGPDATKQEVVIATLGTNPERIAFQKSASTEPYDAARDGTDGSWLLDIFDAKWAPYDPARPKPYIGVFPYGAATMADVTAAVAANPRIKYWAYENEPHGGSTPGGWYADTARAFRAAVLAGNPAAFVLGTEAVNANFYGLPEWESFLAAGGGDAYDILSWHPYNQHGGFLMTGKRGYNAFFNVIVAHGQQNKGRAITEGGDFYGCEYGLGVPIDQSRKVMLDLFLATVNGVPKELYYHYWPEGFWQHAAWPKQFWGQTLPIFGVLYAWGLQWIGTLGNLPGHPVQVLNFGIQGEEYLIGFVSRAADGSGFLAAMSDGMADAPFTAQLAGPALPATLAAYDAVGAALAPLPVVDGRVTVPAGLLPTYVRLPAGVAVSSSSTSWGTCRSSGAGVSATMQGGADDGCDANDVLHTYADALLWSRDNHAHVIPSNPATPRVSAPGDTFRSKQQVTPGNPLAYEVDGLTGPIDSAYIACPAAWRELGTILHAEIQVDVAGSWVTLGEIQQNILAHPVTTTQHDGFRSYVELHSPFEHEWRVEFPLTYTTKARVLVHDMSRGNIPTQAAYDLVHNGDVARTGEPDEYPFGPVGRPDTNVNLARVGFYDSTSTLAAGAGPSYLPTAT